MPKRERENDVVASVDKKQKLHRIKLPVDKFGSCHPDTERILYELIRNPDSSIGRSLIYDLWEIVREFIKCKHTHSFNLHRLAETQNRYVNPSVRDFGWTADSMITFANNNNASLLILNTTTRTVVSGYFKHGSHMTEYHLDEFDKCYQFTASNKLVVVRVNTHITPVPTHMQSEWSRHSKSIGTIFVDSDYPGIAFCGYIDPRDIYHTLDVRFDHTICEWVLPHWIFQFGTHKGEICFRVVAYDFEYVVWLSGAIAKGPAWEIAQENYPFLTKWAYDIVADVKSCFRCRKRLPIPKEPPLQWLCLACYRAPPKRANYF